MCCYCFGSKQVFVFPYGCVMIFRTWIPLALGEKKLLGGTGEKGDKSDVETPQREKQSLGWSRRRASARVTASPSSQQPQVRVGNAAPEVRAQPPGVAGRHAKQRRLQGRSPVPGAPLAVRGERRRRREPSGRGASQPCAGRTGEGGARAPPRGLPVSCSRPPRAPVAGDGGVCFPQAGAQSARESRGAGASAGQWGDQHTRFYPQGTLPPLGLSCRI